MARIYHLLSLHWFLSVTIWLHFAAHGFSSTSQINATGQSIDLALELLFSRTKNWEQRTENS